MSREEAAEDMVKMVKVHECMRIIVKEVYSKIHGTPMGALIGTTKSDFNDTLMSTLNNTPPEILSASSGRI